VLQHDFVLNQKVDSITGRHTGTVGFIAKPQQFNFERFNIDELC